MNEKRLTTEETSEVLEAARLAAAGARPVCDTPGCGRTIPRGGEGHPEICPVCLAAIAMHRPPVALPANPIADAIDQVTHEIHRIAEGVGDGSAHLADNLDGAIGVRLDEAIGEVAAAIDATKVGESRDERAWLRFACALAGMEADQLLAASAALEAPAAPDRTDEQRALEARELAQHLKGYRIGLLSNASRVPDAVELAIVVAHVLRLAGVLEGLAAPSAAPAPPSEGPIAGEVRRMVDRIKTTAAPELGERSELTGEMVRIAGELHELLEAAREALPLCSGNAAEGEAALARLGRAVRALERLEFSEPLVRVACEVRT
jgi:hypothetical protein